MPEWESIRGGHEGGDSADPGRSRAAVPASSSDQRDISRAPSNRSRTSSRKRELKRIYSAHHLDDHSVYHHDEEHDSDTEEDYSEEVREKEEQEELEQHPSSDTANESSSIEEAEVRDGVPDTLDVEKGLEKQKSRKKNLQGD